MRDNLNSNDSKNQEIREKYDQSADSYNTRYKIPQYIKYSIIIKELMRDFKNIFLIINQQNLILDLGGGTGLFNRFFNIFRLLLKKYIDLGFPSIENFVTHIMDLKIIKRIELETRLKQNENQNLEEQELLISLFLFFFIINELSLKNLVTKCESCKNSIRYQTINHVINSDISFGMLLKNKKRTCGNYIKFDKLNILCDAEALPLRENSIFAVFTFTVFQNFANPLRAINEIIRVINPNGVLIGSSLNKKNTFSFAQLTGIIRKINQDLLKQDTNDNIRRNLKVEEIDIETIRRDFFKIKRIFEQTGFLIPDEINCYINSIEDYFFILASLR